jgi:purine-binding chemotaxis protein CheW
MVGYRVDAVTRIMKISPGSILPAPDLMLAGLRSQYILGVCKTEMGLLIVANLVHLLEADEVEALKTLKPQ